MIDTEHTYIERKRQTDREAKLNNTPETIVVKPGFQ